MNRELCSTKSWCLSYLDVYSCILNHTIGSSNSPLLKMCPQGEWGEKFLVLQSERYFLKNLSKKFPFEKKKSISKRIELYYIFGDSSPPLDSFIKILFHTKK